MGDMNTDFDVVLSGSGKGGKQPKEAPDNLFSNQTAMVLDVLSEGEIEGIVGDTDEEKKKNIFYNEVPLVDPNGTPNFTGVTVYGNNGTPDQSAIPGFDDVRSTVAVNQELPHNVYKTVSFPNDGTVTAVIVTISTDGFFEVNKDGDTNGTSCSFVIEVSENGGPFEVVHNGNIRGKQTDGFDRDYRVQIDDPTGTTAIRVKRTKAESTSLKVNDKISFSNYTRVIEHTFSYPNLAVVGHILDAKQFGNQIPQRQYRARGIKARVPSNYDPITRTYTGPWDGTLTPHKVWTNCGPWVLYELVTNKRFGLGQFVRTEYIDLPTLYQTGKFADEMVSDGKGGLEPRWTCNTVINTRGEAFNVLKELVSNFRASLYWMQARLWTIGDHPRDPVKIVTNANVINGKFTRTGESDTNRVSVVNVSWNDPDLFMRRAIESVEDPDLIREIGYKTKDFGAFGCTSRAQARRLGRAIIFSQEFEAEMVSWKASYDHMAVDGDGPDGLAPGDVVLLCDRAQGNAVAGGRLTEVDGNVLTGSSPTTAQGAGTIWIEHEADGSMEMLTCTYDGQTITLTEAPLQPVATNDQYIVLANGFDPEMFVVLKISEEEENVLGVTAVRWDENRWAAIYDDIKLDPKNYMTLPKASVCLPPAGITVEEGFVTGIDEYTRTLNVKMGRSLDTYISHYVVRHSYNNGEWITSAPLGAPEIIIKGVKQGAYRVQGMAVNQNGVYSNVVETVYVVGDVPADEVLAAGDVIDLSLQSGAGTTFTGRDVKVKWALKAPSSDYMAEAGIEPGGSAQGIIDPMFRDCVVTVRRAADSSVLRVESVVDTTYTYAFEKNHEDTGGAPVRSVIIGVQYRDKYGRLSAERQISVSNPAPVFPTPPLIEGSLDAIRVRVSQPDDPDWQGIRVYTHASAGGVTVTPENLAYAGPDLLVDVPAKGTGVNSVIVVPFDVFGAGSATAPAQATPVSVEAQLGDILVDLADLEATFGSADLPGLRADVDAASQEAATARADLATEIATARAAEDAIRQVAELAQGSADGAHARITDEELVRAQGDAALAARASTVEAQMAGAQDSFLKARILNEEATRASADNALAGRSSTIEARLEQDSAYAPPRATSFVPAFNHDPADLSVSAGVYDGGSIAHYGPYVEFSAPLNAAALRKVIAIQRKPMVLKLHARVWQVAGPPTAIVFYAEYLNANFQRVSTALPLPGKEINDSSFNFLTQEWDVPFVEGAVWVRVGLLLNRVQSSLGDVVPGAVTRVFECVAEEITSLADVKQNLSAQISNEETARADADSALAARSTALEARAYSGGNLLTNTTLETTAGWEFGDTMGVAPANLTTGTDLAGDYYRPVNEHTIGMRQMGVHGSPNYLLWRSEKFAVKIGSYVQWSVLANAHRANISAVLYFYDYNDNLAGYSDVAPYPSLENAGHSLADYVRLGVPSVLVPATAVSARLELRKMDTYAGQADSWAWFTRPYVGEARQGQTEWNPFVHGSGRAAQAEVRARVASEEIARATADSALASRASDLEATVFNGPNQNSNLAARITNEEAARAAGDDALALRSTKLEATANVLRNTTFHDFDMDMAKPIDEFWATDPYNISGSPASAQGWYKSPAWEGGAHLISTTANVRSLFSRSTIQVDPRKKYRISCRAGAYHGTPGRGSVVYAGFVGMDGAGAVLDHGEFGTFRYCTMLYENLPNGTIVERSAIVTGEGNDSWVKFPPGTKQIRLMVIANYLAVADIHTYFDYFRVEEVTDYEETKARIAAEEVARANADSALATRASTLEASVGTASLMRDPTFAEWIPGTQMPTHWDKSPLGAHRFSRVASRSGIGYSWQHDAEAGSNCYSAQLKYEFLSVGSKWVIEADVWLKAGTFQGAGILMQTPYEDMTLPFETTPDSTGKVVGAGVGGQMYKFRKMVSPRFAADYFYLYVMSHWSSLGSISAANSVVFERVNVRPATPEEVATNTVLPPLTASVNQMAGALAAASGRTTAYWQLELNASSTSSAFITAKAEMSAPQAASISFVGVGAAKAYERARTFYKEHGSGDWNAAVYSEQGNYGSAYIAARGPAEPTRNIMIGLGPYAPSSGLTGYEHQFGAWYWNSLNGWYIYEGSVNVLSGIVGTKDSLVEIEIKDGLIRYWIDGRLVRQGGTSNNNTLHLFSSLYTDGPAWRDVQFGSSRPTQHSSVAIGASEFSVYNPASSGWVKAMQISNGNALFTGGLQVGAYIRLGPGQGWPVALKPRSFDVTDGDPITFGTTLAELPTYQFQMNNLAPLNAGEVYKLYIENPSKTGGIARLKIQTPGTPTNHNLTNDTTPGSGPTRQIDKSSLPQSASGNYRLRFSGNVTLAPTMVETGGGSGPSNPHPY